MGNFKTVSVMCLALVLSAAGTLHAQETQRLQPPADQGTAQPAAKGPQRAPRPGRLEGEAVAAEPGVAGQARTPGPVSEVRRLPADALTQHKLDLPGRTLSFTATAGKILLETASGKPEAEVAYISYTLNGAEPATRPVTFAMNGGPGSASGWLHLGLVGPWRMNIAGDGTRPSSVANLLPNAETWLDFTDLVLIDPVGTGLSQSLLPEDETKKKFYSVSGDIESLGQAIRIWLDRNERMAAPKVFLGESYAGFRGPKLAHQLATEMGIGLSAMVLLSPVLDFSTLSSRRHQPWGFVAHLPSYAATVRDRKGPITRADLADVEAYAAGDFLADLTRGERDQAAVDRIVQKVTALTGLDAALVKRLNGRIDQGTFMRELNRDKGEITSAYDGTVTKPDPNPSSPNWRADDAMTDALTGPVTAGMTQIYHRLGWKTEGRYHLSASAINRVWDFGQGGRSSAESVGDLRASLSLDPKLEVLVAHGLFDFVTPYFANKLLLDQIAIAGLGDRLRLVTYAGGHMFYSRDASRVAFRAEVEKVYTRVAERAQAQK